MPPIEYVDADGQAELAASFRDLAAQASRPAAVYTYSHLLQAALENMLGVRAQ